MNSELKSYGFSGNLLLQYLKFIALNDDLTDVHITIRDNPSTCPAKRRTRQTLSILAPFEDRDIGSYLSEKNLEKFRESCYELYTEILTKKDGISLDFLKKVKANVEHICK